LRGPKVLGPPRIIDAERLAAVLEGLPYEMHQQLAVDGVTTTMRKVLRRARADEPGGFVEEGDVRISAEGHLMRSTSLTYFAAEPPHALLSAIGTEQIDGYHHRRLVYRNRPDAMWIQITDDGVDEKPIQMPRSRGTIAKLAAIHVEPEHLEV